MMPLLKGKKSRYLDAMKPNGQVKWLVATVPVLESFLLVQIDDTILSRHDKVGKLGFKKLDSQKIVPAGLLTLSWKQDLSVW